MTRKPPIPETPAAALETAWRIHDAQADWTGKVDNKASFAVTLHTAMLTVSIVLFDNLSGALQNTLFALAALALSVGAILAASVVAPRLRPRGLRQGARSNYIYFGHARHWSPDELTNSLRVEDPLPQLSRQIVVMAQISWTKHIRVGWSIWLGVAGGLLLLVAAVLSQA
jgi:hypothetical protein